MTYEYLRWEALEFMKVSAQDRSIGERHGTRRAHSIRFIVKYTDYSVKSIYSRARSI